MQNQNINFDAKLKQLALRQSGKRVLLHACCAPCASHCIGVLTGDNQNPALLTKNTASDILNKKPAIDHKNSRIENAKKSGFFVSVFYYNPCIMPLAEYQKRADNLKKLCAFFDVDFFQGEYDNAKYLRQIKGLEDLAEGGERCRICFYDRLLITALTVKESGFDYFCTTLTVSPHKDSTVINKLGFEIAAKTGVAYLPSDFKKGNGYLNSIKLSQQLDLYRQDYCGCSFSKRD